MPRPWRVLESAITFSDPWLRIRSDKCLDGDGRVIDPYHVLEYPDWVNVVALMREMEIVLVQEYRHGAGQVVAGLPCGSVEPSDKDPGATARRELLEETGFAGGIWYRTGCSYANPASQTNLIHFFLAIDVQGGGNRHWDPNEEIEVLLEQFRDFLHRSWHEGSPAQAYHVAALHFAVAFVLGSQYPELVGLRKVVWEAVAGPQARSRQLAVKTSRFDPES